MDETQAFVRAPEAGLPDLPPEPTIEFLRNLLQDATARQVVSWTVVVDSEARENLARCEVEVHRVKSRLTALQRKLDEGDQTLGGALTEPELRLLDESQQELEVKERELASAKEAADKGTLRLVFKRIPFEDWADHRAKFQADMVAAGKSEEKIQRASIYYAWTLVEKCFDRAELGGVVVAGATAEDFKSYLAPGEIDEIGAKIVTMHQKQVDLSPLP